MLRLNRCLGIAWLLNGRSRGIQLGTHPGLNLGEIAQVPAETLGAEVIRHAGTLNLPQSLLELLWGATAVAQHYPEMVAAMAANLQLA